MSGLFRLNVWGGPGAGKSTFAALAFASLKACGHRVELVTEACKDWAYEGKKPVGMDQAWLVAEQIRREDTLLRKGVSIVTDSPVMMQLAYCERDQPGLLTVLEPLAKWYNNRIRSIPALLVRAITSRLDPVGRFESVAETTKIDGLIAKRFLKAEGDDHPVFDFKDEEAMSKAVIAILKRIG